MKDTPAYIIETIAPIFNKQGYVGTSLSDLTEATNLTKGALYCNFKNKEELALKSFEFNIKKIIDPLFTTLKKEKDSISKLFALTNYYRSCYQLTQETGGCPILNVGVDAKHNNIALHNRAMEVSKKLYVSLTSIIEKGIECNEIKKSVDAETCAMNIYSMIEGAIFMSFVQRNEQFLSNIINYIDTEIIQNLKI